MLMAAIQAIVSLTLMFIIDMAKKQINIKCTGKVFPAYISYMEHPPWKVSLVMGDLVNIESGGDDLFEALVNVRIEAEKFGILTLCNGARKDVYPSAMSRSMGGGVMAYKLEKGKQARRSDMINIFESCDESQIASPTDQRRFYESWLESLKE